MRKSNWLVIAIAVVASAALLWAWFALGFYEVDSPVDLLVSIVWWVAVVAIVAGICWAESRRRERMRLAFIGEGVVYNPEAGVVRPRRGESEAAALQRTLAGLAFDDDVRPLDDRTRTTFRWVVRSRKFKDGGAVWEGVVLPANDPTAKGRPFSSREDLAALLAA